ncbi:MAG: hypothetical protein AAFW00_16285 [Bacteroidota bacterium]
MKRLGYILFLFILASCTSTQNYESPAMEETAQARIPIDTILERNSPQWLDSSRHQLFIDTTRDSKYVREIAVWQPREIDRQAVDYYLGVISQAFDLQKVELKEFPRDWISIYVLDGQYVTYSPTNGKDYRFSLTDSSVNHYRMEADADAIAKVIILKPEELVLELRTIPQKISTQIGYLRIKKTPLPYLYSFETSESLDFGNSEYIKLITPVEYIAQFDLVVSDAPFLVSSVVTFDKVRRSEFE